jgi:PAS domain S-box-containing protein
MTDISSNTDFDGTLNAANHSNLNLPHDKAQYLLAAIVESSQDSIVTVDFEGTITSWNQAAEQLYGYPAKAAIGQSLTALVLPQNLQEVLSSIDQVKHSQKVEIFDSVRVHKDGRDMHLEVVMSPVKDEDGQLIGVSTMARDVTARRQAEERSRQSEERLRLIMRSVEDFAIFTVTSQGLVESWSCGAQLIFGYTESEILGRDGALLFTPEDRAQGVPRQEMETAQREGRAPDERWHLRKDGTRFYASGVMTLLQETAEPSFVKIARDLTEQRRAAQQLQASEARLRLLVEGAQEFAIFMLSTDNTILTWNSGAERITGFTKEEAIGQNGAIVFTPEDRAAGEPEKEIQTAIHEGRAVDERWHLRQSGERFWASGALMAMYDEAGNVQGFIKIFRDATEQKLAGQALQASEARFRTLSDAVPQLIWTNNAQGEADYFNGRWHDYSGLSYEESYSLGWEAIVHPDDAPASKAHWQDALAKGEIFDVEYRLRRADGIYRWQIGRNVPLRNEEGEIIAWFGTATDIEDLKQAQEALWQAHDELEQRVQERTAQLKHTSQAREQLMERLVNVQEEERHRISRELHDVLGQELTALLMRLQVLPEWPVPDGLQPERRRSSYPSYPQQVENLRGSVKGLIEMVQRLAWEMRPAELDNLGLPKALEQYVEEWNSQYGTRAAFVHNYPKDTANTTGPMEIAIYRVVQEALTNVQRHAQAQNVSVILEKGQSTLTAIVEDDGQGFDIEKDEQGNERTASHRLGLLGMQERMEIVGGTLTIESKPGQGTTVYARVPLSPV